MKILIVHSIYNNKGGEEIIVDNEVLQLKHAGNEVETIFFENGLGGITSAIRFMSLPFNCLSYLKVKKTIKAFRPDIIHLHNWNYAASLSVIYAAKHSKIPIVCTIHNYRLLCPSGTLFFDGKLFTDSLNARFPWKAVKKGVYRNSIFLTFWLSFSIYLHTKIGTWKIFKKIIVNTEFLKDFFLKSTLGVNSTQLVVKPNSTDNIYENEKNEKDDYYLFVGRLNEEKGVRILLNSFTNSKFKLVIIGEGPMRQEVELAVRNNTNITYKGRLSASDVKVYMRTASALIFPSMWFEGMPMTIIEAFSVSTPVIASNLGAMKNMIHNNINGLHFEPGNVEDLTSKIKYWNNLSDESKKSIETGARNSYEQSYTPAKNVNALISIYKSAIDAN